jgi:ADP-ribose pyrophosphatase
VEDKDLVWEEIETEHIVQDEWIDFRKSTYKYPDGRVFAPYYSYSRRDYTVIVASDEDGKYLCVRQFRQGIKEVTTEFPAGGIEKSDGKEYGSKDAAEAALDCAKRELREETGYESSDWTHLITVPSNATISDNYAYVFMARNCMKAGEQKLDDTEYLNVEKLSADEIEELIHAGKFQQSVHVMAWLLAKEKKIGMKESASLEYFS